MKGRFLIIFFFVIILGVSVYYLNNTEDSFLSENVKHKILFHHPDGTTSSTDLFSITFQNKEVE